MRVMILGLMMTAVVVATSAHVQAQQRDFSQVQIKTTKIADRFVGQLYQELKSAR